MASDTPTRLPDHQSFDLSDPGRQEPFWIRYESGSVVVHFQVIARDVAFVEALNRRYPLAERLTPSGRVEDPGATIARRKKWVAEYLAHHIRNSDLTDGGKPAVIDEQLAGKMPEGMKQYVLEVTGADEPRDYAVPDPFQA